ncbi:hypothetical protein JNO44_04715 [Streptomyces noursei]|nr:hypothetical protein JNO44_04715 [Streptomyces noursei]
MGNRVGVVPKNSGLRADGRRHPACLVGARSRTGLRRDRGFDAIDASLAEAEQCDGVSGTGGLFDEGDQRGGGGHGDVDAPAVVEQPGVFRVVDAGGDPRNGEPALGEQTDEEVVRPADTGDGGNAEFAVDVCAAWGS